MRKTNLKERNIYNAYEYTVARATKYARSHQMNNEYMTVNTTFGGIVFEFNRVNLYIDQNMDVRRRKSEPANSYTFSRRNIDDDHKYYVSLILLRKTDDYVIKSLVAMSLIQCMLIDICDECNCKYAVDDELVRAVAMRFLEIEHVYSYPNSNTYSAKLLEAKYNILQQQTHAYHDLLLSTREKHFNIELSCRKKYESINIMLNKYFSTEFMCDEFHTFVFGACCTALEKFDTWVYNDDYFTLLGNDHDALIEKITEEIYDPVQAIKAVLKNDKKSLKEHYLEAGAFDNGEMISPEARTIFSHATKISMDELEELCKEDDDIANDEITNKEDF
jgi:hypothetical protein